MSSSSGTPSPLERFPAEVRAAYERFCTSRDPVALQMIVHAALRDFMPKRGPATREQPLPDDLRLIDDLGFDSLAVAETVFFLEDLFEVRIDNHDLLALHTVGELNTFVVRKLGAKKEPA